MFKVQKYKFEKQKKQKIMDFNTIQIYLKKQNIQ